MTTRELRVRLNDLAACKDADPKLFDADDPSTAGPARAFCKTCTVTDLCELVIRPASSGYDGVCADRVWYHGNDVTLTGKPVLGRPSPTNYDQFSLCEGCGALLCGTPCPTCN
jgi:hypothetical protein